MNLVWLRNDLRLEDNPALYHATAEGDTCCVYTITPGQWQQHNDATAKIAFWRQRLIKLSHELSLKHIPLRICLLSSYEDCAPALLSLSQKLGVTHLFYNREYPLNEKSRDQSVEALFAKQGIAVKSYHGDVVLPPGTVRTQQNAIYKVFTPFSRQWHKQVSNTALQVLPAPNKQKTMPCQSDDIEHLWLIPAAEEAEWTNNGFRDDLWPTDSQKIHERLSLFCQLKLGSYKTQRDIPSIHGTSTLSPYLAMGAISVRQCIHAARHHDAGWVEQQWVTELVWREFYRHLTDQFPQLSQSKNFIHFPHDIQWDNSTDRFEAWCRGETGFPIVDAAMKQLVKTGWMHNRLRMITAAFLTKLLLIDWRKGEAFFMEHLVDGDYASNNGGWQWASSTGADSAPYFRIFNPQRQSERFDPEGIFIKKFIPSLVDLPKKSIHSPTSEERASCGYPEPIIDYKLARERAITVFATAMGKTK